MEQAIDQVLRARATTRLVLSQLCGQMLLYAADASAGLKGLHTHVMRTLCQFGDTLTMG